MPSRIAGGALVIGMLLGLFWRGESHDALRPWERVGADCATAASSTDSMGLTCLTAATDATPLRERDEGLAAAAIAARAARHARQGRPHLAAAAAGWLDARGHDALADVIRCRIGDPRAPTACAIESAAVGLSAAAVSLAEPSSLAAATTAAGLTESAPLRGTGAVADAAVGLHAGFRVTAQYVPPAPRRALVLTPDFAEALSRYRWDPSPGGPAAHGTHLALLSQAVRH